jgi:hypothetical protein
MRYSVIVAAACCLLTTGPALSQQETARPDEREAQDIGQAEVEIRDTKLAQCMKAIGNERFCSCIADESPSSIDFVGYVRILSSSSAPVSADDKALFDASKDSMDECVDWSTVSCPQ